MREFKILPKIQDFELNMVEFFLGSEISETTRSYIKKYGGDSISERYFEDKFMRAKWELSQFLFFKDIYNLTKEFFEVYKRKLVTRGCSALPSNRYHLALWAVLE